MLIANSMFRGKILDVFSSSFLKANGYRIEFCELNGIVRDDSEVENSEEDGFRFHKDGIFSVFFSHKIKDSKYSLLSHFSLTRRFFRAEITSIIVFQDKSMLALAKKGLYRKDKGSNCFIKCFTIPRGSRPLNLCVTPSGYIFFGEYFQNMNKGSVHIYGSNDNGQNWRIVYTFPEGDVNHIHGLFYDKFSDRVWVVTGDRENECIIGYTDDDFKSFNEVFRGGQEYRTCQLFFYPDFIVFATDSQYIENKIKCFDRNTLEIRELQTVLGSVIKGGQVGEVSFLSTTVEPSDVNKDRYAHLWVTKDGLHWEERFKAKKDWLPSIFQFGTFEFPQYYLGEGEKLERLYFSGRALKGLDGKTTYIDL